MSNENSKLHQASLLAVRNVSIFLLSNRKTNGNNLKDQKGKKRTLDIQLNTSDLNSSAHLSRAPTDLDGVEKTELEDLCSVTPLVQVDKSSLNRLQIPQKELTFIWLIALYVISTLYIYFNKTQVGWCLNINLYAWPCSVTYLLCTMEI